MRLSAATLLLVLAGTAASATAQIDGDRRYRGRDAIALTSSDIELVVLKHGGSFASLTLASDAERLNPMWDSLQADREQGRQERSTGAVGHFVCVDGFGQPSDQERAAGMEGHGEAHRLEWQTDFAGMEGGAMVLRQSVSLPRVREVLRRELRLPPNESVVYVRSELESRLDFDPPRELGRARDDRLALLGARRDGRRHLHESRHYAAPRRCHPGGPDPPLGQQLRIRVADGANPGLADWSISVRRHWNPTRWTTRRIGWTPARNGLS